MKRNRIRLLFAAAALCASAGISGAAAPAAKPNVLILFIDDLGRTDFGFDGSKFHETPRLDALAKASVRFTDFYSANPVCSPTRAALMTGKQPQRLGITDWIHPNTDVALSARETTVAEAFKAAGYQTAYVGKWHLGEADADLPTQHGFEWIKGVNRGGSPGSYHYPFRRAAGKAKGKGEEGGANVDVPDLEHYKPGDYLTDALTTETIAFLKKRDRQRPFFLCFGHYAVHTPIQPPANLPKKYEAKRKQLYGETETPTLPAPYSAVSRARQDNPDYAAMVENLDANVGRLLDALDELGQRENTIVIFTADNGGLCTLARNRAGGPTSNLPFRSGKGWTYEGGIRISTLVSWPAALKPRVSDVPAYTPDFFPTLLELAGLPAQPKQHLDGRSLARALRGEADGALKDRPLVWYYPHDHGSGHKPSAALRRGQWKIVHPLPNGPTELFDLAADPGETTDLAARQPDRTAALRAELLQWIEQTKFSPKNP